MPKIEDKSVKTRMRMVMERTAEEALVVAER